MHGIKITSVITISSMQGMMDKKIEMFSRYNATAVVLVMYSPSQKKHTQLSSFIVLRVFFFIRLFVHILPHFIAVATAADLMYVTQTVNINHRRHQVYR